MANYKSGAERYNDRMAKIMAEARRLERERLERGQMPNPSLTSPEEARKYGWEIKGREVRKIADTQWSACCRASQRLADLVCLLYHPGDKQARAVFPTATWAEIIAHELGVPLPESQEERKTQ